MFVAMSYSMSFAIAPVLVAGGVALLASALIAGGVVFHSSEDLQNSAEGLYQTLSEKAKQNIKNAAILSGSTYIMGAELIEKTSSYIYNKLSLLMLNAALINGVLTGSGQPLGMDAQEYGQAGGLQTFGFYKWDTCYSSSTPDGTYTIGERVDYVKVKLEYNGGGSVYRYEMPSGQDGAITADWSTIQQKRGTVSIVYVKQMDGHSVYKYTLSTAHLSEPLIEYFLCRREPIFAGYTINTISTIAEYRGS